MDVYDFEKNITSISLFTTCITDGDWIEDDLIPLQCVRFSYKKARKLIKLYLPGTYHELGLKYYNSYSNLTWRSRDGKWLVITYSMINYVFRIRR